MTFFWDPSQQTSATSFTCVVTPQVVASDSPLRRLQTRLHDGPFWWFGNRVSDLRYWMWRMSR